MSSESLIQVVISPTRIKAGIAEDIKIRLTNTGPGTCTNIIFSMRLPIGLVRLRGAARIQVPRLAAGESFGSSVRVTASEAGHYSLTSPSFSYQDHRGQSCYVKNFVADVIAEPGRQVALRPQLSAELVTAELGVGEWDLLRGIVTNVGEVDALEVEATLTGQTITAEGSRSVTGFLSPGATADLMFHVLAREVGAHVPIHVDLSYSGSDGQRYDDQKTHSIRVRRDRVRKQEMMKVLFLGANPPNLPRLRIDEEIREIEQEIRLGRERDRIQVETKWAVRPPDISRALLDVEPDLVHFAGHGGGGEESFAAEGEAGMAMVVPVSGLVELFKVVGEKVRCVLVNACSTQRLASELSAALPRAYVIGMRQPVGDRSAIRFSVGFYQAMAAGKDVDQAFRLGRAQMMMGLDNAGAPVLLQGKDVISAE